MTSEAVTLAREYKTRPLIVSNRRRRVRRGLPLKLAVSTLVMGRRFVTELGVVFVASPRKDPRKFRGGGVAT
jgi:hypothetical protein